MRLGGGVTGRVVNSSGKPLRNICASAYNPFNSTTSSFVFNPAARDGRYTLTGLGSGSYTVELGPCDPTVNLIPLLRHVKVAAPRATTGVNATLRPGGSATGTVTAASAGLPLANTCVFFISRNPGNPGGVGITDADGKYLVAGIEPGKYTVNFDDRGCEIGGLPPSLAPQWFDNQPAQVTANLVTITIGHIVTGISAALQNEGTITGTVATAGKRRLEGVCVIAWPLTKGSPPVVAISGPTGYALIDLLPARYKVEFSAGCGATGYRTQWWHNASSRHAATVINVSAAHVVNGIDATLTR
jgi:hypothetical protein